MPDLLLMQSFRQARAAHEASIDDLVPLTTEIALARVAEVLPGAQTLELCGEVTEDWLRVLRIQRVLDAEDNALYDIAAGPVDPLAEQLLDEVNVEYLDLLLDLTGDQFMGPSTIGR